MARIHIPILLAAFVAMLLSPPATAQSASAKLYAKTEGDNVLVALQVTPEFGCWFYDEGEDTGGSPTSVTLDGLDGADWTDVWFPDPKIKEDPTYGDSRIFDKKTVLYAAALGVGADASTEAITAAIVGQVCNERACVPWTESIAFRSEGTDKVWSGFPAALLVAQPAADTGDGDTDDHAAPADGPTWTPDFGKEKVMARAYARVSEDDEVELVIQVATPEHWHMYHGPTSEDMGPGIGTPTTIEIDGGNVDWEDVSEDVYRPRPVHYVQDASSSTGWLWIYEGTFHFGIKGEAYDDFDPDDLTVTLKGQSCDEQCVPVNLDVEVIGEGTDDIYKAAFASWTLPEIPEAQAGGEAEGAGTAAATEDGAQVFGQETESDGLLKFILLAIGAGLFTLLMPCTYPMIPITISYFTKQADTRGGKVLPLALVYGLGIVLMFVLIGVLAGPIIQPFATHWLTNTIIGIVFVLFALALFGMITLNPPQSLMKVAGQASSKGGFAGVFLMGLTLVVTSFTCTGPFVGSLLAAGAELGTAKIALGMACFGATMATPFVFLALVPGKLSTLPSAGGWMNTVKVFMGFVELAASIKFFSNADIALGLMILPREVFLILWAGIALVAGLYLLGRINLKSESPDGDIGPGQLMLGTGSILMAGYFFLGVLGYRLDSTIMSAMAPPEHYTRGLIESHQSVGGAAETLPAGIKRQGGSLVVIDDYDLARQYAIDNGLVLLANFTGHT